MITAKASTPFYKNHSIEEQITMKQVNEMTITAISTVFSLLIRCPLPLEKEQGCPFTEYRQGSTLEKKFGLAEEFTNEKRRELVDHHRSCLEARLSAGKHGKAGINSQICPAN